MRKLVLLAGLLALCALNAMAQIPQITQISPAPNTTAAVSSANITITWNTALASTTANADNIKVWGSQTGLLTTASITLSTNGTVVTINPANNFKAGEQIYVSVTTAIQSTAGTAMASSQTWSFTTEAQGGVSFLSLASYPTIGEKLTSITAGDIDGDGDIDIIQTSLDTVYILKNNNGTFDIDSRFLGSTYPDPNIYSALLLDRENSGILDLLVFSENNKTGNFFGNNGVGEFTATTTVTYPTTGSIPSTADLDGDGNLDILKGHRYSLGTLHTTSSAIAPYGILWDSYSAAGDIDGDGDQDVVISDPASPNNKLHILTNDGSASFTFQSTLINAPNSNYISTIRLADMDNDGDLDIIFFDDALPLSIYKNNGNLTFSEELLSFIPGITNQFNIGDFNGDGAVDLVYALNGSIYTALNNGNLSFSAPVAIGCYDTDFPLIVNRGSLLSVADINSDGRVDILVAGGINDKKVYLNSLTSAIQLSTSAIAFATTAIGATTTTSVSLSFSNLSQDISFTSPSTHFTVSVDNVNFASSTTVTAGSTSPQPIYVRFSPWTAELHVSTITSSLGCGYDISLTGEGTPLPDGMVVNTLNDGPGSLRYALENATSGTVITFADGLDNTFTITDWPIIIHHRLNINFQDIIGGLIINSGAFPAIQFDCGSQGSILTGVSVLSSHPSGGVISTCPDIRPTKVQKKPVDL